MIDRLKNPDFAAGILFLAIGAMGLVLSWSLAVGNASRMGPGYMPRVFSASVAVFGIILIVRATRATGEEVGTFALRPFLAVLFAIAAFGFSIEILGLVISVLVLVLIAGMGSPDLSRRASFATAIALALATYLIFVRLLDLTIPVWPEI
jgi:hypothetical protein